MSELRRSLGNATSALEAAVEALADTDVDVLPGDALTSLVRVIATVETRLAGITARAVAAAERAGTVGESGAPSATSWLADTTGTTSHTAAAAVSLGRAMHAAPAVAAGVSDGTLTGDKARSLARALDRGVLSPGAVDAMVDDARDLPAGTFARHVRAREAAADNDRLRRDEEWARERRALDWRRLEDGSIDGRFRLPAMVGDLFATAVRAMGEPDPADTPLERRRSRVQRQADALEAIARHALDDGVGGNELNVRPHISVVVPVEALAPDGDDAVAAGAVGTSEHGTCLSVQAVKELLCDAAVRRLVVDPEGRPLDVGRATRTWSGAQRAAAAALDGGCRGPMCDRPFAWTQLHHIDWWRHGGHTDLDRGLAVCGHCHHLVHDDGWGVELDAATRVATWTSPDGRTITTRPRGPAARHLLDRPPHRAPDNAGRSAVDAADPPPDPRQRSGPSDPPHEPRALDPPRRRRGRDRPDPRPPPGLGPERDELVLELTTS